MRVLLAALAAVASTPAAAESWYYIASNSDDGEIEYADADSVTNQSGTANVNVFYGMYDGLEAGGQTAYFMKFTVAIGCDTHQFSSSNYRGFDFDGKDVALPQADETWKPIEDGSDTEQLRKFACEGGVRDDKVDDPMDDATDYFIDLDDEADAKAN